MPQIDYLVSDDARFHAINCSVEGSAMEVGIACAVSCRESPVRISSDTDAFLVELPKELLSGSERVKAFNILLNILSHEQV
jgi:N-acetylmuramic acid 6-phosphate (MurNAc-6-P) etherase